MKHAMSAAVALALGLGLAASAQAQGMGTNQPTLNQNAQPAAPSASMPSNPSATNMQSNEPTANMQANQPTANMQSEETSQRQSLRTHESMSRRPHMAARHTEQRVKDAQQRLKADGLYKGRVDGVLGPKTRRALAKFQARNGLHRTAKLDANTFRRLVGSEATGVGSSSMTNSRTPTMMHPPAYRAPASAGGSNNATGNPNLNENPNAPQK